MDLAGKKCVPCEGGVAPLKPDEINSYIAEVKSWEVIDNLKIHKVFKFVNFRHTMDFVNKIAELAEEERHHPDLHISYNKLDVEIWTHAIGGLSENDFILAAKIDRI